MKLNTSNWENLQQNPNNQHHKIFLRRGKKFVEIYEINNICFQDNLFFDLNFFSRRNLVGFEARNISSLCILLYITNHVENHSFWMEILYPLESFSQSENHYQGSLLKIVVVRKSFKKILKKMKIVLVFFGYFLHLGSVYIYETFSFTKYAHSV